MLKDRVSWFSAFCLLAALGAVLAPTRAQAVSVSPLRQTVVIDPGERQIVEMEVVNADGQEKTVVFEADAFTLDADGRPVFGQDDEAVVWVTPEIQSIELAPGGRETARFIIAVPAEAEPMSHYLALFAAELPGLGGVGIGTRVGSLLFLHVGGTATESLEIEDFSYPAGWVRDTSAAYQLTLKNTGTIHVIPAGTIRVSNWWGETIAEIPVNAAGRKMLPYTSWREAWSLPPINVVNAGPLRTDVRLTYGVTGQSLTFFGRGGWFVPPGAIALVLGMIFVFLLSIVSLVRRRREAREDI